MGMERWKQRLKQFPERTPYAPNAHITLLMDINLSLLLGKLLIATSHSHHLVEELIIEHPNHSNFLEAGTKLKLGQS